MNREVLIREIQERYQQCGRSFNELQRRRWAAAEAMKLGRGGLRIVSIAIRISPNTIKRGIEEITSGQPVSTSGEQRIRKPGGGRKSKVESSDQQSTLQGADGGSKNPTPN